MVVWRRRHNPTRILRHRRLQSENERQRRTHLPRNRQSSFWDSRPPDLCVLWICVHLASMWEFTACVALFFLVAVKVLIVGGQLAAQRR